MYEPWLGSDVIPCNDVGLAKESPLQYALSCAALAAEVAVVSNIFVNMPTNNTRRIATIVYDAQGRVLTTYFKHELFPVFETGIFEGTTVSFRTKYQARAHTQHFPPSHHLSSRPVQADGCRDRWADVWPRHLL